ncbi:DUF2726 domain-containing protein [Avibacterium paragallinarum]|uniref:DUF2726 domain-containing protein n=2 Tax=Avibacterium paragallinarum TaxID=728 RepID=UPI0009DC2791|nr:DUF2726 domain-containing protein [Avibacterium paragallinarum]AZI14246.1 DUF2726 domain-containing protein [Avibacterium paragallinarum]QIR11719.1 DUF2726 domain-containing protein [Avibacterium paragallinarum]QJE09306.1 DUF2726 domain-containing protein [Avibacterium paragallinarum]QJE11502.1 DUF2726 domain-containing protein [Avibacterium paragallinarum]QJE13702.1 DUF2726 domain-containing protein [Avibacterium paragallinarum]
MKITTLQILIACLVALALFLIAVFRQRKPRPLDGRLYKRTRLMNHSEQRLFQKLKMAFPDYYIFPQIPFSCIATPKQYNQKLFWKINQKRVDFLLCNQQLEALLIIELDGPIHKSKKQSDKERDKFFKCIGLNTLRIDVEALKALDLETLKKQIWEKIKN